MLWHDKSVEGNAVTKTRSYLLISLLVVLVFCWITFPKFSTPSAEQKLQQVSISVMSYSLSVKLEALLGWCTEVSQLSFVRRSLKSQAA